MNGKNLIEFAEKGFAMPDVVEEKYTFGTFEDGVHSVCFAGAILLGMFPEFHKTDKLLDLYYAAQPTKRHMLKVVCDVTKLPSSIVDKISRLHIHKGKESVVEYLETLGEF